MCDAKSFSKRPKWKWRGIGTYQDLPILNLPSAESHAELVRMTHEWISAVTERSDLSDNLVSLFMVRNLFTIDYDSGWQYLWISSVSVFWLEFHM